MNGYKTTRAITKRVTIRNKAIHYPLETRLAFICNIGRKNLPFYKSTGHNSGTQGTLYPFGGLNELDGTLIKPQCPDPRNNANG